MRTRVNSDRHVPRRRRHNQTVFAASTGFAVETSFKAKLSSKEEVVSPKSNASGKAEFKLSKDGKTLTYKLQVKNIKAHK